MPGPSRFAAVDAGVILALCAGDEECQEAIDGLENAGFFFLLTETPLQEIEHLRLTDEDEEVRHQANQSLVHLPNLNFLTPSLAAVELGIAEQVSKRIVERVADCRVNDGLVIAEAGYNRCRFLITRSTPLLEHRFASSIILADFDLSPVFAVSPKDLVDYFRGSK